MILAYLNHLHLELNSYNCTGFAACTELAMMEAVDVGLGRWRGTESNFGGWTLFLFFLC